MVVNFALRLAIRPRVSAASLSADIAFDGFAALVVRGLAVFDLVE
jgi:hypothetical protein